MKLFTKEINAKLFQQYQYGNDLDKQKVVAKIFNPYGRGVWYLLNSDPADPDYIWAIVDLYEVEVGSVSRKDLENMRVPPFRLPLERDSSFSPKPAIEVLQGAMRGIRYEKGGETDDYAKSMSSDSGNYMVLYYKTLGTSDGSKMEQLRETTKHTGNLDEVIEKVKTIIETKNYDHAAINDHAQNAVKAKVRKDGYVMKYEEGGKMEKGGLTGDVHSLTDKLLSQKIQIFLDKVKPFKYYYVDENTNTLVVGLDENYTQDAAEKFYEAATSSVEFFDADLIDMHYSPITGDTQYLIKLKKEVKFANGGELGVDRHRIYFSSFAEVMDGIEDIAEDNGYKVVSIFPDLSLGGVSYGQTKRAQVELEWNGEEKRGKSKKRENNVLNVQIYRMESGNYELNTYFSYASGGMMAKGGVTFKDKVASIKRSLLERRKVSPKVQKDYGKTYTPKEAEESAKRIAGAMRAKEMK